MKTIKEIQAELSNLEKECNQLELEKQKINKRSTEIDSRLRIIKGGGYSRQSGLVYYLKKELIEAELLKTDKKLAKCVFFNSSNSEDMLVAKVTPKQIHIKVAGESATTPFNRLTGQSPNSSPYWRLKLDVDTTLANYQASQT